jgi:hypothetical protein
MCDVRLKEHFNSEFVLVSEMVPSCGTLRNLNKDVQRIENWDEIRRQQGPRYTASEFFVTFGNQRHGSNHQQRFQLLELNSSSAVTMKTNMC